MDRSWAILAGLGAILSCFGSAGGGLNVDFPQVFQCFYKIEVSSKNDSLGRLEAILEVSWIDLGASRHALGAPRSLPGDAHDFREALSAFMAFIDFYCLCRLSLSLSHFAVVVGSILTLTTGCRNLLIGSTILL